MKTCVQDKDVIITIVGYPQDVEEVYFGPGGLLESAQPGTVLIDMTTTSPKLAQRIVLELKDKVELDYQADTLLGQLADETVGSTEPNNRKDAIDALTALGYSSMDAAKAVKQADPNADMDAEDILKAALKYLM